MKLFLWKCGDKVVYVGPPMVGFTTGEHRIGTIIAISYDRLRAVVKFENTPTIREMVIYKNDLYNDTIRCRGRDLNEI